MSFKFSARVPGELGPNRLALATAQARRDGRELIDLTISNPTRVGLTYPSDLLAPLADPRALRYDPAPSGLADARQAVAADYARRGVAVPPERIVLTSGTSEAYSLLFKLLAGPGDELLVPRPSYPLFDHLTSLDAVTARPYDLSYHGTWSVDVASIEHAWTSRTRAVLVVSPNNPTGSFVSPSDLEQIASLCVSRDAALVADEVFADYELEPGRGVTAGRVLDRGDVLTFGLGGLSKTVGLPQVKLGWIAAAGPDSLVGQALERLELIADTYLSVSTLVQVAAAGLLARGASVRQQIAARVLVNYQMLQEIVRSMKGSEVLRAEGGWYAVLRVPTLMSEEDLVVSLVEREGVLTHPGYFFDFPNESHLVISLLTAPRDLETGLDRIVRHLYCTVSSQ